MNAAEVSILVVVVTAISGSVGAWIAHRRTPAEEVLTKAQSDQTVASTISLAFDKLLDNLRTDYDRVTSELLHLREECQEDRLKASNDRHELMARVKVLELEVAHLTTEVETYRTALGPVSKFVAEETIKQLKEERKLS